MPGLTRKTTADRLTKLLTADLDILESQRKDEIPGLAGQPVPAAVLKARVDALAQITRTLEKLLELKRLEILTLNEASAEDEAETVRLRDELLRRLRAVDERRQGTALFPDAVPGAGGER